MDRLLAANRKNNEAQEWLSQTAILVNRQGVVHYCPRIARQWLLDFFQFKFQGNGLPTKLHSWLWQNLEPFKTQRDIAKDPVLPLTCEMEGHRLIVRFRANSAEEKYAIVLEKQTIPNQSLVQSLGLTRRQIEVLLEVEKGKSNVDIASALFISPQTVRTHLQNIFKHLGVQNRTAAVAKLRQF